MRLDIAANIIESKVEQLKRVGIAARVVVKVGKTDGLWRARLVQGKEILAAGQSCSLQSALSHLANSIGLMK